MFVLLVESNSVWQGINLFDTISLIMEHTRDVFNPFIDTPLCSSLAVVYRELECPFHSVRG
jgi:hypothetical protein